MVFHDKSNLLLTFYMNAIVRVFLQRNFLEHAARLNRDSLKTFSAVW